MTVMLPSAKLSWSMGDMDRQFVPAAAPAPAESRLTSTSASAAVLGLFYGYDREHKNAWRATPSNPDDKEWARKILPRNTLEMYPYAFFEVSDKGPPEYVQIKNVTQEEHFTEAPQM